MDSKIYKYAVRFCALILVFITMWIYLLSDGINGFLAKGRYTNYQNKAIFDTVTGQAWILTNKENRLDDLFYKEVRIQPLF